MRRRRDIFGNGSGRMSGIRNLSPAQLVTRILGILSVILAIVMVVNLNRIMATAVFAAKICSYGVIAFVVIAVIAYLLLRLRWRIRSRFWRW